MWSTVSELLLEPLEVRERDRDRVLAELRLRADRTRALIREPVVAHPDPHAVVRATRFLRLDAPVQLDVMQQRQPAE